MRLALVLMVLYGSCRHPLPRTLRVCADPNNLPFSNERQEGFENRIVQLIAQDMGLAIEYHWSAQRRGFVRNTLNARRCDLVPGIVTGAESLDTTAPYYRSTYVFASLAHRGVPVTSLDSPELKQLRIGVQVVGDDYANTPPVHALAMRGIVGVQAFRVTGDSREPNPPLRIMDALLNGRIDVALVWGPQAGYFASRSLIPLSIKPIPAAAPPAPPFQYSVSMGVRRGDKALKMAVEESLERHRAQIESILDTYGVPRVSEAPPPLLSPKAH